MDFKDARLFALLLFYINLLVTFSKGKITCSLYIKSFIEWPTLYLNRHYLCMMSIGNASIIK